MSAISGLSGSGSALSFSGLASGIDSQSVIDGLLAVQRSKVSALQSQQAGLAALQGTFNGLRSALADLQTKAGQLARSVAGPFDGRKVSVSDESVLRAAAGTSATPGQYTFKVTALATAHQVASQGVADPSTSLRTGTLQFKVGGATTTLTVDSTNNTLQGLAAAINSTAAGVRAAVINDGSSTPFRLLLTSTKTGTANSIQVTNNLTGGTGASLNLDPATQTIQLASNAQITLGSGASAITVTSASNTVDSVVPGVTLNLLTADSNKSVTVSVSNDTDGASKAVSDFVDSYNSVIDFINSRSTYDQNAQKAGVLLGNNDANTLENLLSATVGATFRSASQQAARLSSIGVTFTDTGKLRIDQTKLNSVLSGVDGLDGVRRLFALSGTSSNAGVSFLLGTTRTQATTNPVGVKLTQAATQASLSATSAVSAPVTIDSSNNQLALTVNGKALTVQLASGSYDSAALAAEFQAAINAASGGGAAAVTVTHNNGNLNIITGAYGGSAGVSVTGGSALSALGFTAGQHATGTNVAGYFLINGVRESAIGSGQVLIGSSGNTRTDGLQVKVTLGQSQLIPDPNTPEASVTVSRGLGAELDRILNSYLDPVKGRLKNIDDGFQRQIDDLQNAITRTNNMISRQKDALLQQFAEMEAAVSQLRSLGATLSSQLGMLSTLGSGSSSSNSGKTA